jgi:hypothetical protein
MNKGVEVFIRLSTIMACCTLAFCACSMAPTQEIAGGGVETGNTKAVGRVLASDSISLNAITVSVYRDAWEAGTVPQYRAWAALDDSGYYSFDSLATGRYRVSGTDSEGREGFCRTFAVVPQRDSMFLGVDSLRKIACVKGKITRYDGSSCAGITVALRGTSLEQTVSGDGTFDFPQVPPGEQVLVAQAAWLYKGVPQLQTIFAAPGDTSFVSFFLPAEHSFMLSLLPGQVWSYRYEWKFGQGLQSSFQDTSWNGGFLYYVYVKDTLMANLLFHVIRQWGYGTGVDRTVSYGTNYLYIGIHADTILLYESYPQTFMPTLLKSASTMEQSAPAVLANPVKIVYDTSAFCDFRVPVIFNMTPNKPWYSRPPSDRNFPLIQRYAGNEIVSTEGGTFNCMRMEWEWAEWEFVKSTPVKGINYLSDFGMVKQIIEDTTSFYGKKMDSLGFNYLSQYIGTDTTTYKKTFPRLPQAIHDSIQDQVMSHWNIGKYKRWITAVDTSHDGSSSYVDLWNKNSDPLFNLMGAIRPKFAMPLIGFSDLVDTLSTLADTLLPADIANPDRFINLLIAPSTRNAYAQGWDDCDWDFAANGLSNPGDTIAPYGRSAQSQALFELLNGYYLYIHL